MTGQKFWLVENFREPAEIWNLFGFRSGKAAAAAVFSSLVAYWYLIFKHGVGHLKHKQFLPKGEIRAASGRPESQVQPALPAGSCCPTSAG